MKRVFCLHGSCAFVLVASGVFPCPNDWEVESEYISGIAWRKSVRVVTTVLEGQLELKLAREKLLFQV